jgi:hypothetical protein
MDAYLKLRPFTDIEECGCDSVSSLFLVYRFTPNPIHCVVCGKEVAPERLELTVREVDEIASCFSVFSSLYKLWLDSGEYEVFAKQKLIDPEGQVNRSGMSIAQHLSKKWPTHYWWFYDTEDDIPEHCPSCRGALDTSVSRGIGRCDHCCVMI